MNTIKIEVEVDIDILRLAVAGLSEAADLVHHGQSIDTPHGMEAQSGIVSGNAILARMLSKALDNSSAHEADKRLRRNARRDTARRRHTGTQGSVLLDFDNIEAFAANSNIPLENRRAQLRAYISGLTVVSGKPCEKSERIEQLLASLESTEVPTLN